MAMGEEALLSGGGICEPREGNEEGVEAGPSSSPRPFFGLSSWNAKLLLFVLLSSHVGSGFASPQVFAGSDTTNPLLEVDSTLAPPSPTVTTDILDDGGSTETTTWVETGSTVANDAMREMQTETNSVPTTTQKDVTGGGAETTSESTSATPAWVSFGNATSSDQSRRGSDAEVYLHVAHEAAGVSVSGAAQESHPCARPCLEGAPPLRCHYRFEMENYLAMSKACYDCPRNPAHCDLPDCVAADGQSRPLVTVNRRMPGPAIEVCQNDTILVYLDNKLATDTTSIHWHGHHQRGTPYMDGVPFVTQCPISPHSTFLYRFVADTPGTHFWHSHSGHQRADGAFGALVVRVPRNRDPHAALFDLDLPEHTIQLVDWASKGANEAFLAHHHGNGTNKPSGLLVNGRSWLQAGGPPGAVFSVVPGKRHRFRLINAGFLNCPVELSIDNHTLLIISSDGSDLRPHRASSLVSYAGERFDLVVEANQAALGSDFWIRFRGLMDCSEKFHAVHQAAILHYRSRQPSADYVMMPPGPLSYDAARARGHQVNSLNVGTGTKGTTVIPELESLLKDDVSLKEEPDFRFYISYDFYRLDNPHYYRVPHYGFLNVSKTSQVLTPQFNHISMKNFPFPLLSERDSVNSDMFCNSSTMQLKNCENYYCECPHVLQVPLNSVIELILIDEGNPYDASHPFHLHGHAFRVVAMERLGFNTSADEVRALDAKGLIKRKLQNAPLKDTCTVPDGGYTILRVLASNPGYWLFHCHIEFHVEVGMALVLKVGDHAEYPPVPRGFPRCNNWLPSDEDFLGETGSGVGIATSYLPLVVAGVILAWR